jgi:RNA polymerase sigma factor (sigma-70 family)
VKFDRQEWFEREILVHEVSLRGYLRRLSRSSADTCDGVQETYARLLRLSDAELARIHAPNAFLFTTARNVVLEWLRKRRPLTPGDAIFLTCVGLPDETPGAWEQLNNVQELLLLSRAVASLPRRCRQVLTLRKLDAWPQKKIAAMLGISESTVEKHAAQGVKLCAAYFQARGVGLRT